MNLSVQHLNRALVWWIWGRSRVLDVSVCHTWSLHVFGWLSQVQMANNFTFWYLRCGRFQYNSIVLVWWKLSKKLLVCFGTFSELDTFLFFLILLAYKFHKLKFSCSLNNFLVYCLFLQKQYICDLLYSIPQFFIFLLNLLKWFCAINTFVRKMEKPVCF